jgi:N-acetylneuraminate synthase
MSTPTVTVGDHTIGAGHPCYVIAEIGINHNGELENAKKLIDVASEAGCQAVKFQKRTPDISTPENQKNVQRETPWGVMTYLEYKHRIEFGDAEYKEIGAYSAKKGLDWFASPWDVPSVEFLEDHGVTVHKVASASITDIPLLEALRDTGKPIILSTGMSTMDEIDKAVSVVGTDKLVLMHATSTYPLDPKEANLLMINTLRERFGVPVGYSGHETGLQVSLAAVALGADALERHITLDRAMWGTDHGASLEPGGLSRLIRDVRVIEEALGDGVKRVYESEEGPRAKLRRAL